MPYKNESSCCASAICNLLSGLLKSWSPLTSVEYLVIHNNLIALNHKERSHNAVTITLVIGIYPERRFVNFCIVDVDSFNVNSIATTILEFQFVTRKYISKTSLLTDPIGFEGDSDFIFISKNSNRIAKIAIHCLIRNQLVTNVGFLWSLISFWNFRYRYFTGVWNDWSFIPFGRNCLEIIIVFAEG